MRIIWLPRARADVSHVRAYIEQDNRQGAKRVVLAIYAAVERLEAVPHHGRPGRVAETRELPVPRTPYIVAYTVIGDRVVVTAVLHGAQEWPEGFG